MKRGSGLALGGSQVGLEAPAVAAVGVAVGREGREKRRGIAVLQEPLEPAAVDHAGVGGHEGGGGGQVDAHAPESAPGDGPQSWTFRPSRPVTTSAAGTRGSAAPRSPGSPRGGCCGTRARGRPGRGRRSRSRVAGAPTGACRWHGSGSATPGARPRPGRPRPRSAADAIPSAAAIGAGAARQASRQAATSAASRARIGRRGGGHRSPRRGSPTQRRTTLTGWPTPAPAPAPTPWRSPAAWRRSTDDVRSGATTLPWPSW